MSDFQAVCKIVDVPDHEGKTVVVGRKRIAVFREGSQFYAIDDMCPHMGASLSPGVVEDGVVSCPWHAWADNPRLKIGCYAVRVVGDEVQVEVPAEAV